MERSMLNVLEAATLADDWIKLRYPDAPDTLRRELLLELLGLCLDSQQGELENVEIVYD